MLPERLWKIDNKEHRKKINICFETSLSAPAELLEMAIEYVDEIFIDINTYIFQKD